MADIDWEQGEIGSPTSSGPDDIDWESGAIAEPSAKQNTSLASDLATDVKRGVQQLPGALTGLADIPVAAITGERYVSRAADALGEATGFQPGKWAEEARAEYSEGRRQAEAEIDKAWEEGSAADVAGAYLRNPGKVAGIVAESLPSMLAGGVAGRAAMGVAGAAGRALSPVVAGAGGEAAIAAGQAMDQIDESVDARRTAAAAAGTGVLTGALGYAGGRAAQRMGLVDPETAIAGGAAATATDRPPPGLVRRMLGGAMSEGVFEELPQSAQEQMWSNWAEGRDLMEGVSRAAVEGTLAGGAMGAGANVLPARRAGDGRTDTAAQDPSDEVAGLLPAPVSTGTPTEQILQGEVERENAVAAAEARAADLYRQRAEFEAQRPAARPSEQMGLDPAVGPMSAAAALAVDSAAAQQLSEQSVDPRHIPAERARDRVPPPAGSSSTLNEFADLVATERADADQRRQQIADTQILRREVELSDADQRVADARAREAAVFMT